MAGFTVTYSNRLECLAVEAAALLRNAPPSSPFETEYLVVQTPGMERWLSLEIARRNGIFGGFQFMSPAALTGLLEKKLFQTSEATSPFDRHNFTWAVARILEGHLTEDKAWGPLKEYIGTSELKRFQIASRIADLFDQYAVYRPDLLAVWEQGGLLYDNSDDEAWQQRLWLQLIETFGTDYETRHARLTRIAAGITDKSTAGAGDFPRRIVAFGISILPPIYLELLHGCSRWSDVHLYMMNPSQEFWGDVTSDRVRVRVERKMDLENPEEAHFEAGNELLASMGRGGRDFFSLLFNFEKEEKTAFEDPGSATLLQKIQQDIFYLKDRSGEGSLKEEIKETDESVKLVSCHSPLREVEVLQDYLLSRFEADASLEPRDILVLTPDINAYSPYIEGVFGVAPEAESMPWSIADRTIRNESRIADAFLSILNLVGTRLALTPVLALLEAEPVREKFNIEIDDLETIRDMAREAGIRWGLDGDFRENLGLPGTGENTWRHGLDRLILGYAADGSGDDLFQDTLPFGAPEGEGAVVLGNFLAFCDNLFSLLEEVKVAVDLKEWHRIFSRILDTFFKETGDTEQELRYILGQVNRLPEMEELTGYNGKVSFEVMKSYFTERFNTDMTGRGFITGGVTFCSMVPLRSIPFRVVCLLGMNDDAFPRRFRSPGFDLMAREARPGDRNIRESDRYLFLETILSSRESLYISHVGKSIRDNSLLLPSNLVLELVSYIEDNFYVKDCDDIKKWLVTGHPLQAFSRDYFIETNRSLFSYRHEACEVARVIAAGGSAAVHGFDRTPIALKQGEAPDMITDRDLAAFLINPARHFMQGRLGISIEIHGEEAEDTENFSVQSLDKYLLQEDMLNRALKGEDTSKTGELYRAMGILPHGNPGVMAWENIRGDMHRFAEVIKRERGKGSEGIWNCRLDCEALTVAGRGTGIRDGRLIAWRPSTLKEKDRLRTWVQHLLINASGEGHESVFIGTDNILRFGVPKDPAELLGDLASLFLKGLEEPLAFFPRSSWAWMETLTEKDDLEKAMKKADAKFEDGFKFAGERNSDPWFSAAFPRLRLADIKDSFTALARRVYGPMIEYSSEEKVSD